jgi:hypothetical protein
MRHCLCRFIVLLVVKSPLSALRSAAQPTLASNALNFPILFSNDQCPDGGGVAYLYGTVSVYLSLHPRETVALYAVPRYAVTSITTVASVPDAERSGTTRWGYPGLTYGVGIGTGRRVFVEVSHLGRGAFAPSQVSVAFSTRVNWGE